MRAGLVFLVAAYVLSQFYRAFLAVLSPILQAELALEPGDLAISSGIWFIAFAAMQMPVGAALDRLGPRLTASVLLGLGGGGGAIVFATAQGAADLHAAMTLIGIGCAPVLMASYYIFARTYPPAAFGALAGAVIGIGSLGNIAGAAPLAWFVQAVGWRAALWGLAGLAIAIALALWLFVRDPERAVAPEGRNGSVLDILRLPGMWAILPLMAVNYAPAAAIRGLWAGPYLSEVFGASAIVIGNVTLAMALAMVLGNFAYGPMDRLLGSRKRVVFLGNLGAAICLAALVFAPSAGLWPAALALAGLGLFGSSFPAIMAHGRAFFPPHLVGRGVTFLNMFSIGGAGVMQFASRPVYQAAVGSGPADQVFARLFLFFLVPLALGLVLYLFSREAPAPLPHSMEERR